jgi:hypothetical protein
MIHSIEHNNKRKEKKKENTNNIVSHLNRCSTILFYLKASDLRY